MRVQALVQGMATNVAASGFLSQSTGYIRATGLTPQDVAGATTSAIRSAATNAIAPPLNTYAVYRMGSGAESGPLPPGYVTVSRWVSPAEASLWVQNRGTAIPSGIPQNGTPQVYVATAGVAMLTAGITNGVTYNTNTSSLGVADWTQKLNELGDGVKTLGQLAGTTSVVGMTVSQSTGSTATPLSQEALGIATQSTLIAGVQTAIKGGSFLTNLETDAVSSVAEVAANGIGTLGEVRDSIIAKGSIGHDLAHAELGCASSAALGTGCAGGAIDGALSAGLNPVIDAKGNIPPAVLASIDTLVSGSVAGALGFNAQGAVTAATLM